MENHIQQIQQVQQYIQEKLCQPLSTAQLADVACLSPVHFHRRFKASTGLTPALYVELYKIKRSLELLKHGMQVQEVAFQLGFANYETFTRAFKKHCQIAPADLQYLLRCLENETDADKPLVVSGSRRQQDLCSLVKEAVERGTLRPEQFQALQVCIITPKTPAFRTRRAEEKYRLSLEPALARELRSTLGLQR